MHGMGCGLLWFRKITDKENAMAFVIPKWWAHEVADWSDLLIKSKSGDNVLNEATAAVINYLPLVGITKLTRENADDAWRRIAIHQALFGSWLCDSSERPYFVTKHDVERHIGIETEGANSTFYEFCSRLDGTPIGDLEQLPSYVANDYKTLLEVVGLPRGDGNGGQGRN